MDKIINGKRYNTETAEKLIQKEMRIGAGRETLYQKMNEEYFIHQKLTGYGEEIVPLSDQAAMDWVAAHFPAPEYIRIFGSVDE